MIRSVLYLSARPGGGAELEEFFREHRVLERALAKPGCLGAALHRPVGGGDRYVVTATWESPSAYDAWVDDPWRRGNAAEVEALLEGSVPEGGVFEVVERTGVETDQ
ncbi:antibiotic biosynthesis monooxygenase family protein [Saccharothrix obliqua]|uniref:antibiotic biosynthesis monooxygenase family protein n=1 Tax=Saccharothrix obliqua TaxID=2861747 RepID=UPI001C5F974A|nr:antibiotic biosynthesis monooxygenase family protein [Saccharothrix obliqua]MBW4718844.1 antibiotic biosynthesis monooxygenase [Saccharothrix obliqua]